MTSLIKTFTIKLEEISRRRFDSIAYVVFAGTIIALFRHVLVNYWLYDDPYILRNVVESRLLDFFLNPDIWLKISASNLTPWIALSYGIDYFLFGLNHQFYYAHHLVSIWLISIAFYSLLKLWVNPLFAFYGTFLFLVSAPVAASAEMLMTRHYIEGLFFSLLAFFFFVKSIRENSFKYSLLSSLFYIVSLSAKEIYVPLFIVLLFLPEGSPKKRLAFLLPSAVGLSLYLIWRYYMLGGLMTGHAGSSLLTSYKAFVSPVLLFENLYGSLMMMSGVSKLGIIANSLSASLIVALLLLSGALLLRRRKYAVLFFFFILFFSVHFIPFSIINLSDAVGNLPLYRLSFLIAIYNCAIISLSAAFLSKKDHERRQPCAETVYRMVPFVLLGLLILILMNTFLWVSNEREKTLKPLTEEGKFFMKADKNSLLVKSDPLLAMTSYYENLEFFKRYYFREQGPLVVYDRFAFIDDPLALELRNVRVFKYNRALGAMSEITGSFFKERDTYLSSIKKLPLEVTVTLKHATISYSMGPSREGRYFTLLGYRPGIYCMMLEGKEFGPMTFATSLKAYFRFGWQAPEGWVTFSPEWLLDFSNDHVIQWGEG